MDHMFSVDVSDNMTICNLKEKIKINNQPKLGIPPRSLDDPILKVLKGNPRADIRGELKGEELRDSACQVGQYWQEPPKHVIAKPPCK